MIGEVVKIKSKQKEMKSFNAGEKVVITQEVFMLAHESLMFAVCSLEEYKKRLQYNEPIYSSDDCLIFENCVERGFSK